MSNLSLNRFNQALAATGCIVFLVATNWFRMTAAMDPQWTTSWMLLWIGLFLLVAKGELQIRDSSPWLLGLCTLTSLFLLGPRDSMEDWLQHLTLWTLIWAEPTRKNFVLLRLQKTAPFFALAAVSLLLFFAFAKTIGGNWGHPESYHLPLPWAHRTIAFESLAFMMFLGARQHSKWSWSWMGILTLVALMYQVRSVLLFSALWGVCDFIARSGQKKHLKWAALGIVGLFISIQVMWNALPDERRVQAFSQAPDVVKTLDVKYNWNEAKSSTQRVAIWDWTLENLSTIGQGSGSWKWQAEGHVQKRIGECDKSIRRAHSDLLQAVFELGLLPILFLIFLGRKVAIQRWKFWLFASPMLLFTFPSERAEIVLAMVLVYWNDPNAGRSGMNLANSVGSMKSAFLTCAGFFVIMGSMWLTSQHAFGKMLRGQCTARQLSSLERNCVDLFPSDVLMNQIDVLIATQLHASGQTELAVASLEAMLEKRPFSLGAHKALWSIAGGSPNPNWDCQTFHEMSRTLHGASHKIKP